MRESHRHQKIRLAVLPRSRTPKNGSITSIPPPKKTKNLKHLTADPTPIKK